MTKLQQYLLAASAVLVLVFGSVIYIIHWQQHSVSVAVASRDAVWQDSLARAKDIRHVDTLWLKHPSSSVSFKNTNKDTVKILVPDSLNEQALEDYYEDLLNYVADPLDTAIALYKDSVHVFYNPLTHLGTIGLILAPTREINTSDSLLVGEPCAPVQWYNSRGAWFGYGAAAVLVVVEVSHLITK